MPSISAPTSLMRGRQRQDETRRRGVGSLIPEDEVPLILSAILRCGARLRKLHGTELENDLSDRLRNLLDRDSGLRACPVELFREVPLYDRKRARQKQLGRST